MRGDITTAFIIQPLLLYTYMYFHSEKTLLCSVVSMDNTGTDCHVTLCIGTMCVDSIQLTAPQVTRRSLLGAQSIPVTFCPCCENRGDKIWAIEYV